MLVYCPQFNLNVYIFASHNPIITIGYKEQKIFLFIICNADKSFLISPSSSKMHYLRYVICMLRALDITIHYIIMQLNQYLYSIEDTKKNYEIYH